MPGRWASIPISACTRTRASCASCRPISATGLLQSSILFGSFAGVLWVLSSAFSFRIAHHDYAIPGFMLWAAIIYASAGSLVSYWVGGNLINRNAERYAREADLRFSLVRINEHLDGISLAGGEEDERRRVEMHLSNVLAATRRLVTGLTNLTWVTAGFGWVTNVAPILVAAPLYFTGKISFGGLMMAAAAFTQAQSSLRWFVDNFSTIADWRATLLRVASFRQALTHAAECCMTSRAASATIDGDAGTHQHRGAGDRLARRRRHAASERSVELRAGERVLIVGRARHQQDAAVPRAGGPVALGLGPHHAPEGRTDLLSAARHALPAARHAARGTGLSVEGRRFGADAFARALRAAWSRAAASRCSMRSGAGIGN